MAIRSDKKILAYKKIKKYLECIKDNLLNLRLWIPKAGISNFIKIASKYSSCNNVCKKIRYYISKV